MLQTAFLHDGVSALLDLSVLHACINSVLLISLKKLTHCHNPASVSPSTCFNVLVWKVLRPYTASKLQWHLTFLEVDLGYVVFDSAVRSMTAASNKHSISVLSTHKASVLFARAQPTSWKLPAIIKPSCSDDQQQSAAANTADNLLVQKPWHTKRNEQLAQGLLQKVCPGTQAFSVLQTTMGPAEVCRLQHKKFSHLRLASTCCSKACIDLKGFLVGWQGQ